MDLDFGHCYQATRSRDSRFDGWFIVGVYTTGVYCRPSCLSPVSSKPGNEPFYYRGAAAAQLAGLRLWSFRTLGRYCAESGMAGEARNGE